MNLFQAYGGMWKKTFDFKSRATRKEFWFVFLMNYIISFGLSLIRSIGSSLSMPFINFDPNEIQNISDLEELLKPGFDVSDKAGDLALQPSHLVSDTVPKTGNKI